MRIGPGARESGEVLCDPDERGYTPGREPFPPVPPIYEAAHFVHVGFPGLGGVHSFEQFAKTLDKPDAIRDIIEGEQTSFPAPSAQPPPTLAIPAEAETAAGLEIAVEAQSRSGLCRPVLPFLRSVASLWTHANAGPAYRPRPQGNRRRRRRS